MYFAVIKYSKIVKISVVTYTFKMYTYMVKDLRDDRGPLDKQLLP